MSHLNPTYLVVFVEGGVVLDVVLASDEARVRQVMEDHVLQLYAEDEDTTGMVSWMEADGFMCASDPSGDYDTYAWELAGVRHV